MIKVESLNFGYAPFRSVLSNISLTLERGHIHGLLGCNGIGKTTLLKLICGIIRPNSGSVRVDGMNPFDRKVEMFRELMIIPEEFDLPNISLEKYARITAPFYPRFDMGQMLGYCQELGVRPEERLHSMSMGQRKKAYIAFALACNVEMLLMDEPTNGLDIPSKSVFRRLLAGYVDERRMVVISTHQVAEVEQLLDNIVILDTQGVALNATTAEICSKLKFGKVSEGDKVIYSESTIAGDMAVMHNDNDAETQLNIELLFNATTTNRNEIAYVFNKK
ncbi:MAG: ABC transporter ATP-binding protein [Alistipes sp.]|nr:ABC transporter ATP-binding protein [Alistipes sp.]